MINTLANLEVVEITLSNLIELWVSNSENMMYLSKSHHSSYQALDSYYRGCKAFYFSGYYSLLGFPSFFYYSCLKNITITMGLFKKKSRVEKFSMVLNQDYNVYDWHSEKGEKKWLKDLDKVFKDMKKNGVPDELKEHLAF